MRIDLGAAYRGVGRVLATAGHAHVYYSLGVDWPRHPGPLSAGSNVPTVEVYVQWPGDGTFYRGATCEEALAALDADLVNHPAPAAVVPDVVVLTC